MPVQMPYSDKSKRVPRSKSDCRPVELETTAEPRSFNRVPDTAGIPSGGMVLQYAGIAPVGAKARAARLELTEEDFVAVADLIGVLVIEAGYGMEVLETSVTA
jgi:hypothetical protein